MKAMFEHQNWFKPPDPIFWDNYCWQLVCNMFCALSLWQQTRYSIDSNIQQYVKPNYLYVKQVLTHDDITALHKRK